MGPGLFWNFPSKTSCTVSQTLLQTMLLSRMAGMKEQQFIEEKPLLPETRGQDTEMARGVSANAPSAQPRPQPARPTHRWHEIARHWLGVTRRRRTSGYILENCETFVPAGDWKEHDIDTPYGMLHVVIRGAPKGNKPAILTYHDVGLNRKYTCVCVCVCVCIVHICSYVINSEHIITQLCPHLSSNVITLHMLNAKRGLEEYKTP
ncbi:protein NDRG4, partial [Hoplias malabaricus]|uniref:protein NDRG4 n=1 Tax=Hoplias malabaricus TaxID=27720 RepID=UPI0034631212